MKIPLAKPFLGREEAAAASEAVLSGWVTQGPRVRDFERAFAEYTGAREAVAVASCTAALHLSLHVSGIGAGDEVICPSLSFIATANAVRYSGARPVFADVDPTTYNLDPTDVQRKITDKTRAVILVHQMGIPADVTIFRDLCEASKLVLIEDAACAAGSRYANGRKVGADARLACFSFHPRKVITTGDGGMITTDDPDLAARLRRLRQHAMSVSDADRHGAGEALFETYPEVGFNYRMTDIQAAVGLCQLKKLDWIVAERRKIGAAYDTAFGQTRMLRTAREPAGSLWNLQSYPVYLEPGWRMDRDELIQKLFKSGIAAKRGIMTAHREVAYLDPKHPVRLPVSENLSDRSLLLPLFVPMTEDEVRMVVASVIY